MCHQLYFTLNCCVLSGDHDATPIFAVTIPPFHTVSHLRKAITETHEFRVEHHHHGVDADNLLLWTVSVPIDENFKKNLSQLDLDEGSLPMAHASVDEVTRRLGKGHLHIVVKHNPQAAVARPRIFVVMSLVRRAESVYNAALKQSLSEPLSSSGRIQAEALGKEWANVHIDHLYSSTIKHAFDTANEIAEQNKHYLGVKQSKKLNAQYWGSTALRYAIQENDIELWREVKGAYFGSGREVGRDYRPSGDGESLSDVAMRGRQFIEKEVLERLAVPLATPLDSFKDKEQKVTAETLPDGMPHIVVVSHDDFLGEMYDSMLSWKKKGSHVRTSAEWAKAGSSFHVLLLILSVL